MAVPVEATRDLVERGRRLRREIPRSALAELPGDRGDRLAIIDEQNVGRLSELVPMRAERMSQSAFAFFRGSAAIMAADLADAPATGLLVAACGDAHVANFGFYASPLRTLVFDLNDFDEAAWGPWEWDLKRLTASVVVGGRDAGRGSTAVESAARSAVLAYRAALRALVERSPLGRYYAHLDPSGGLDTLDKRSRAALRRATRAAQKRTGERAVRRLTERGEDGRLRFVSRPPTMTPLESDSAALAQRHVEEFLRSASPDVQLLFRHYSIADTARRVVGVGSVGTRCALVLFEDGDGGGLIMQSKQAGRSVLEQYGRVAQPPELAELVEDHGQGARVVGMQRILQAVSDPFLGHVRADGLDLYGRQFHDMKGGVETEGLDDRLFADYARGCAVALARAHAQSANAAVAVGYIGAGRALADAIVAWSLGYADLAEQDHRAFVAAGRERVSAGTLR